MPTTDTLTVAEVLDELGMTTEEVMEGVLFDRIHAPTLCAEGCEVEPDGRCPHGHRSLLLLWGVI